MHKKLMHWDGASGLAVPPSFPVFFRTLLCLLNGLVSNIREFINKLVFGRHYNHLEADLNIALSLDFVNKKPAQGGFL